MAKLEELAADYEVTRIAIDDAKDTYAKAVYIFDISGSSADLGAKLAALAAWDDAWTESDVAWDAYQTELNKTKEKYMITNNARLNRSELLRVELKAVHSKALVVADAALADACAAAAVAANDLLFSLRQEAYDARDAAYVAADKLNALRETDIDAAELKKI